MLIGILQTGHVHETLVDDFGEYPGMFERLLQGYGFSFRTWSVVDMDFPDSVHDADGWLLTGSRHGAYDDLPFIAPLEDFIRRAYHAHVPMVGICFGHQIIAQALGGTVRKSDKGWGIGAHDYAFGDEVLTLNAWHQDQVVTRPPDAEVAARSDFCENAALVYGNRAFTVQAHPEIRDDYLAGLIDKRAPGIVPEAVLADARARLGAPQQSHVIADRIAEFFRQPRGKT
jgi:GMP synthase-like glutamine amidotransferase